MDDRARSLAMLGVAIVAVVLAVVVLPPLMRPDRIDPPASGEPAPASGGLGGTLAVSGDRTGTLTLDRAVSADGFALGGRDGLVAFEGQPATIARIAFDGLEFYLDPEDCTYASDERDAASGLAPLEASCAGIGDVRDTAVITVEGTLRVPADQLGLRGDLPATGGEITLGNETLAFEEASLDLRRPAVLQTGPNSFERNPPVYPVSLSGRDGTLELEYDSTARELRLIGVELPDGGGNVEGESCAVFLRGLGELSPRVAVVEVALNCTAVEVEGIGNVPLAGTLVVDATGYRP